MPLLRQARRRPCTASCVRCARYRREPSQRPCPLARAAQLLAPSSLAGPAQSQTSRRVRRVPPPPLPSRLRLALQSWTRLLQQSALAAPVAPQAPALAQPRAQTWACLRPSSCAVREGAAVGPATGAGAAAGAGAIAGAPIMANGCCACSHCWKLFPVAAGILAWKASASSSNVICGTVAAVGGGEEWNSGIERK